MEIWREKEKRRGGVVDAIAEERGARRRLGKTEGKGDDETDGERRNGKEWVIDKERLVKALIA